MQTTQAEREAYAAVRGTMRRLRGPQAPVITNAGERLHFMRRHMHEIDAAIRHGWIPAPTHLLALAAHALILYMERDEL